MDREDEDEDEDDKRSIIVMVVYGYLLYLKWCPGRFKRKE